MRLLRRRHDPDLLALLEESGRNVQLSTMLLRDLIADHPDRAHLSRDLLLCEQEGDRITHDLIHRLDGGRAGRAPFDSADGHELAKALDDIVDSAEQTGDMLQTYSVEAPMEQAGQLAEVLVACGEHVAGALRGLRTGAPMSAHLVEINRLENEGDRISRAAVASLFASGIDPMVVIRWKDIFESLETAVDACEHVAHVLEGIELKHRR